MDGNQSGQVTNNRPRGLTLATGGFITDIYDDSLHGGSGWVQGGLTLPSGSVYENHLHRYGCPRKIRLKRLGCSLTISSTAHECEILIPPKSR